MQEDELLTYYIITPTLQSCRSHQPLHFQYNLSFAIGYHTDKLCTRIWCLIHWWITTAHNVVFVSSSYCIGKIAVSTICLSPRPLFKSFDILIGVIRISSWIWCMIGYVTTSHFFFSISAKNSFIVLVSTHSICSIPKCTTSSIAHGKSAVYNWSFFSTVLVTSTLPSRFAIYILLIFCSFCSFLYHSFISLVFAKYKRPAVSLSSLFNSQYSSSALKCCVKDAKNGGLSETIFSTKENWDPNVVGIPCGFRTK